jgi:hypothetical protein
MSGDIISLNLHDSTRESLSSRSDGPEIAPQWDNYEQTNANAVFEPGEVVVDKNAPEWSDDDRIVVEEVTDSHAESYVIEENEYGIDSTVAHANPSYPETDIVVEGHYFEGEPNCEVYAFPISRLMPLPDNEQS